VTVIGYFSRQAVDARAGNRGQATALFLVVAGTLLALVFATIHFHHVAVGRMAAADSVDAIALSAATWEARGLNLIAALNDGVIQCLRAIRWVCLVWAGLALAAAFGVGLPAFLEYTKQARRLISGYWKTAHTLVAWSEKIRKATPYLVLAETATLSRKRNVTGVLFPLNPRGPHDGKNTLELHLEPGPPVRLVDAIAPVSQTMARIRNIRFLKGAAKAVLSALDAALGAIAGTDKGPIRMLVPEKDFQDRQRVRFTGFQAIPDLPIPLLGKPERRKVFSDAEAEPYGGGSAEMTWKSRLAERGAR
jgi:hypothetical protein